MAPEYRQRAPDIQHFLKRAQDFFIDAALEIRTRFPNGDAIVEMLQVLDPDVSRSTFPSLVPLASRFPYLISEDKLSFTTLPFDSDGMGCFGGVWTE